MKILKYTIAILFCTIICTSCNESKFLEEEPLDFFSPENSMITTKHFETSLNYLYNQTRHIFCNIDVGTRMALYYGTDFAFNATDYYKPRHLNDYANKMVPTDGVTKLLWQETFKLVANANVVLNRINMPNEVGEADKIVIIGEAKFFRAFAYRILAHLYGGVPIELNEVMVPRRDYVRASREDVYKQIQKDLEEAYQVLPDIDKVKDGKVNKQVAQHLLSEIYICLGLYDEAVKMATKVIDYKGLDLMENRFGSRKNEDGDVYWDLFRLNNQNRSSGNTEGLWVMQYDYQNPSSEKYEMAKWIIPMYKNVMLTQMENGKEVQVTAFVDITDGKGGNGAAWIQPTEHFFTDIWAKGSENDIRNSRYNIIRDLQIDNPKAQAFGKWLVKDGYAADLDPIRIWFPIVTKYSRVRNYPEDLWKRDKNNNPMMTAFGEHILISTANQGYKDEYFFRLAETYLLRAEAYLMKNDVSNATKDINIVRSRANAVPAEESEVDIYYLLDERLRELYFEETRMLTLCRMGRLVEMNRKYNPASGKTIYDYHNLWPIPYSEIERNTEAVLEQNPGYK